MTPPAPTPSVVVPRNRRILVIDDNEAIHRDFQKILAPATSPLERTLDHLESAVFGSLNTPDSPETIPFDIDTALQGSEGIERLRHSLTSDQPYALAFVDVRMPPGLDGIETAERLWALDPSLQIVLCTAYSDYSWEEISRRLSQSDNLVILKKPFDSVEVLQLAHALTEKWRLMRVARLQLHHLESLVQARTAELRAEIEVRRQAEIEARDAKTAAENASRAKSAFLANMSHEIRTPMNAVLGMCQLLLDSQLTDEQRDLAQTLNDSGEILLGLLNDVLDISKIEADRLALEQTAFNLQELVDGTVRMFAGKAHEKGLDLVAVVDPAFHGLLLGDPGRLSQVLLNLVSNAIKFTEHGEVSLTVRQIHADTNQVQLEFNITDTGIGIKPEDRARLFEAFIQADSSITRRFGGTGLGLAICRRLVELMGGSVDVTSSHGAGSTFSLRIPFPRSRDSLSPATPSSAPPNLKNHRILVVDDCATNRKLIRHLVEGWSGRIEECAVSTDVPALLAAAAAQGRPFATVLLDFHMPAMDGLTLAAELHKIPNTPLPPLILLTSHADRPPRETLERLGIQACLFKPVRKLQLAQAFVSLLEPRTHQDPPPPPPPLPTAPPNPESSKIRVLVAEDNPVNCKLALLQLKKFGFEAEIANNGYEAVQAVQGGTFDLVLMDCQMPELDGLAATRRIRAWERESHAPRRVPIIALTSGTVLGIRDECLQAGMDKYVSKPVRWAELRTAVHQLIPRLSTPPSLEETSPSPASDSAHLQPMELRS